MGQRNIPMRLFALVTAALALDYDAERKKKKDKLESYDCEGTAIADAITSVTNVEVFGCIDFETGDEDGDAPAEALAMKKPPEGVAARCLFKCAEGFEEATSERMFNAINAERKKKGKKTQKEKRRQEEEEGWQEKAR